MNINRGVLINYSRETGHRPPSAPINLEQSKGYTIMSIEIKHQKNYSLPFENGMIIHFTNVNPLHHRFLLAKLA